MVLNGACDIAVSTGQNHVYLSRLRSSRCRRASETYNRAHFALLRPQWKTRAPPTPFMDRRIVLPGSSFRPCRASRGIARRSVHTQQDRFAGLSIQLLSQGRRQQSLPAAGRLAGQPLKFPETLIHAVDFDFCRARRPFDSCVTTPSIENTGQAPPIAPDKSSPNKPSRATTYSAFPETRRNQVAQRVANRFTHQERSAEYSGRGGYACQHSQIRAPIPGEVTRQQSRDSHRAIRIEWETGKPDSDCASLRLELSPGDGATPGAVPRPRPQRPDRDCPSARHTAAVVVAGSARGRLPPRCFSPPESSDGR